MLLLFTLLILHANAAMELLTRDHPRYISMVNFVSAFHNGSICNSLKCERTPSPVSKLEPSLSAPYQLRTYNPDTFQKIRNAFGINENEYSSLFSNDPSSFYTMKTSEKSGAQFYITSNGKYFIKSVLKQEAKKLRQMLVDYSNYMIKYTDSLIIPIVSLLKVRLHKYKEATYYAVMTSAIPPQFLLPEPSLDSLFDLKGSKYQRYRVETVENKGKALKDENWRIRNEKIRLGTNSTIFLDIIERDSSFLKDMNLWDYSLLIGKKDDLETSKTEGGFWRQDNGGIRSASGRDVYYLGIIDYLLKWDSTRELKTLLGSFFVDRQDMDPMPPIFYSNRFIIMMRQSVEFPDEAEMSFSH